MLADVVKTLFEQELSNATRDDKRLLNNALSENKWLVAFPTSDKDKSEFDTVGYYNKVLFVFRPSTIDPIFLCRGNELTNKNNEYTLVIESSNQDHVIWTDWSFLSVHIQGTIWIETSTIKKAILEPVPFSILDTAPTLSLTSNEILLDAVIGYMGLRDSYQFDIETHIENYLVNLPPEVLCISDVYIDITSEFFTRGETSSVIRYNGDVIGYVKCSGRELSNHQFFTNDMKKFQNFLREIVDNCQCYDKMVFDGVKNTSGLDADIFLPVPGLSTPRYYGG